MLFLGPTKHTHFVNLDVNPNLINNLKPTNNHKDLHNYLVLTHATLTLYWHCGPIWFDTLPKHLPFRPLGQKPTSLDCRFHGISLPTWFSSWPILKVAQNHPKTLNPQRWQFLIFHPIFILFTETFNLNSSTTLLNWNFKILIFCGTFKQIFVRVGPFVGLGLFWFNVN